MKLLLYGDGNHYKNIQNYFGEKGYCVAFGMKPTSGSHYDVVIAPPEVCFEDPKGLKDQEEASSFSQKPMVITESIIADLLLHTEAITKVLNIVVMGYNKTGKKIVYALTSLGMNVSVCVDHKKDSTELQNYLIDSFFEETEELKTQLRNADVIINTKPEFSNVDHYIPYIRENTYILDTFGSMDSIGTKVLAEKNVSYKKIYTDLSDQVECLEPEKSLSIQFYQGQ